jgi:hypothetical protein
MGTEHAVIVGASDVAGQRADPAMLADESVDIQRAFS